MICRIFLQHLQSGSLIVAIRMLHGSEDLNVKGAVLHILGDTLSSVAVIAGAIWIAFTG